MPLPGTQYNINTNMEESSAVFNQKKCWQKRTAVDNSGNVWVLSFDMKDIGSSIYGTVLELHKFDGSSYSEITAAQLTLSDYPLGEDGFCAYCTGSMVFNADRTKLCMTYTTQTNTGTAFYWSLVYREFDIITSTWGTSYTLVSYTGTISDVTRIVTPDLVVIDTTAYITFFAGLNCYLLVKYENQIGQAQLINLSEYPTGTEYHCTIEKNNYGSFIYIATYNETTQVTSLYSFTPRAPVIGTPLTTVAIAYPVICCDDIGDVHFFGKTPTLVQGRYAYYDVSAGALSAYTVLIATGLFSYGKGYGICFRRENESATPYLYVFYVNSTNEICYLKYTGTWAASTTLTTAFTDAEYVTVFRELPPSSVYEDFVMCTVENNDGATPYTLSAWHSRTGSLLPSAPSTGGYYVRGDIRLSKPYGIDIDKYSWSDIVQYPSKIIAVCNGVETVDLSQYALDNDANDTINFCTGTDIKEYDNRNFDDLDVRITCVATSGSIDANDPDRVKHLDLVSVDFIGGAFTLTITNENNVSKTISIASTDSNIKKRVNLRGRSFNYTIEESSVNDFKVNELRFYLSTTELVL